MHAGRGVGGQRGLCREDVGSVPVAGNVPASRSTFEKSERDRRPSRSGR